MLKMLIFVAYAVIVSGCSDERANTVVASRDAPDGRHSAVLFDRDCGATTGFSTQLSVLRDGEKPTGNANAFVADTDHGQARAGGWGGPWTDVTWLSKDRLLVRYATNSRVFTRIGNVAGVRITYQKDLR